MAAEGRLAGRTAIVTGGCSGIGLATARRFAGEGANVVIADVDDDAGGRVAAEIGARYVHCDVTDADQVESMVAEADSAFGSVDIALNNAGINPPDDASILETGVDAWRRVQEVNLTSVYLCCKAQLPYMRRQHRVVRGRDGGGDLADLVLRQQGRRAGDDPRAGGRVRP